MTPFFEVGVWSMKQWCVSFLPTDHSGLIDQLGQTSHMQDAAFEFLNLAEAISVSYKGALSVFLQH